MNAAQLSRSLGAKDQPTLKLIVRRVSHAFLAILDACCHLQRCCRQIEQRTGDLSVIHLELRPAATNEAGRDRLDHGRRILHGTEWVVAARVDLGLQKIRTHPASASLADLVSLASRALRSRFPAPLAEVAAKADDPSQVVRLDIPLARAGIDRAIPPDLDGGGAWERIVRMIRRHRQQRGFVERCRRTLRDGRVVLGRDLREDLEPIGDILVREKHQSRALRLRNQQIEGPEIVDAGLTSDAAGWARRISQRSAIDDETAGIPARGTQILPSPR
jgi:hypothetical protein